MYERILIYITHTLIECVIYFILKGPLPRSVYHSRGGAVKDFIGPGIKDLSDPNCGQTATLGLSGLGFCRISPCVRQ